MTNFGKFGSPANDARPRLQLLAGKDVLSFNKEDFRTSAKLLTNIAPPQVRVVFNHRSMEKVRALCEACDIEIGALGLMDERVANDGTRIFKIYDIFVPEQECSPTVTKMTPDGIFKLFYELDAAYGRKRAVAIKDKLSFWWHSHVEMGTSPSGQDEREFTTQSTSRQMFFMSIGNKRGDLHVNVKLKVPELSNWAQWEIRDIKWEKDWETVVSIKDEVHPLLLQDDEKPYRVRTFTDPSAGEIIRDPKLYAWAQEQVKAKVKNLSFYGRSTSYSKRSTLVLPEELADIKVEEYQVNAEEDLKEFVMELWGERPPKPVPVTMPVTGSSVTDKITSAVVPETIQDVPLVDKEDAVTTASPETMEKPVSLSYYPKVDGVTSLEESEYERSLVPDFFKLRKWWPAWLTGRYYDLLLMRVRWWWMLPTALWMIIVVLTIQPLGWLIFTAVYQILKFVLWDWYAVPIKWASTKNKARKERRRQAVPRRTGVRVGNTAFPSSDILEKERHDQEEKKNTPKNDDVGQ